MDYTQISNFIKYNDIANRETSLETKNCGLGLGLEELGHGFGLAFLVLAVRS